MLTFQVYALISLTETQTHPSPTRRTFHHRLTLPCCHNDWLSMLQPEGMMSSHHCLSVRLAHRLAAFLLSVCLSVGSLSVGLSSRSASFSACRLDWELGFLSESHLPPIWHCKSRSYLPTVPTSIIPHAPLPAWSCCFSSPGALEGWVAW